MTEDHPLHPVQHLLPDSIKDLLAVISAAGVVALVKYRGGTRLNIPKHLADDHPIHAWLSPDDVEKLRAYVDGGLLDIPKCLAAVRRSRDLLILHDQRQGLTLTELALKYRLTERAISKSLRRTKASADTVDVPAWQQHDLFD